MYRPVVAEGSQIAGPFPPSLRPSLLRVIGCEIEIEIACCHLTRASATVGAIDRRRCSDSFYPGSKTSRLHDDAILPC